MIALAYYLLKVAICSGILFLYYYIALRNKVFHQWNRFYLLLAVIISLIVPIVQITIMHRIEEQSSKTIQLLQVVQSPNDFLEEVIITTHHSITMAQWVMYGYLLISIFLLFSLVFSLFKIISLIKSHVVKLIGSIKFVNTKAPGTPFSFFRFIFWNDDIDLQSETGQQIFQHELVHVQEKHTWDKIFMQVVIIVFWCNPFFWLIRRELKLIHEFIADQKAVGQHGTEAFAAMILQSTYPQQFHSITNQFFQTSIKRRLSMLMKIQNPKISYISRVLVLPILAFIVLAFTIKTKLTPDLTKELSTKINYPALNRVDTVHQNDTAVLVTDNYEGNKYKAVRINGNLQELWINDQPVPKDELSKYEPTIDKIKIMLLQKRQKARQKAEQEINLQEDTTKHPPLYIVNGKEFDGSLSDINPNSIESVSVLKNESAIKKYGEKAQYGVIEIHTKTGNYLKDKNVDDNGATITDIKIGKANRYSNDNKNDISVKTIVMEDIDKYKNYPILLDTTLIPVWNDVPISKDDIKWVAFMEGSGLIKMLGEKAKNGVVFIETKKLFDEQQKNRSQTSESIFNKLEVEASIDKTVWRQYLGSQLQKFIENAAAKGMTPGQYTVNVRFLVEKNGNVKDVEALNDPGFGLGKAAADAVRKGPKWEPGLQNGKKVNSYHTQPITFVIDEVKKH